MTVQYPALLWFLLAVLIPILIHLFYFRRIRKVEFSNLAFLRTIEQKTSQTKKLKRILILISRILFLIFLVLTFAELLRQSFDKGPKQPDVIFVDNSASMLIPTETSLSAINEAVKLVDNYMLSGQQDDRYYLLTNNFERMRPKYAVDLKNDLAAISASSEYRTFDEVIAHIQGQVSAGTIYYLSDFHYMNGEITLDSLQGDLELIQVVPDVSKNVFVDTVYFENLYYNPVYDNKLVIELAVSGEYQDAEPIQIKVLNENQLIYAGQVTLGEASNTQVEVPVNDDMLVSPRLLITIDDYPVSYDNNYYLIIPSYQKPVVTYVYERARPNDYLRSVYSNESLFDFQVSSIAQLDYERLNRSDLIILDDLQAMPGFVGNLSGKNILIIPSGEMDLNTLGALQSRGIERLADTYSARLDGGSLKEPFFGGLFDQLSDQVDLPSVKILYRSGRNDGILLRDQFREPYLTRHIDTHSDNTYYLVGSPLASEFTNLPIHSIFVPLMYQLAFNSIQASPILSYRTDQQYLQMPFGVNQGGGTLSVVSEEATFIPNQIVTSDKVTLELPTELKKPGYYYVLQQGDTVGAFALNASEQESFLNPAIDQQLEQLSATSDQINYTRLTDISSGFNLSTTSSDSLWKYTLALALFFLTAEILLARFL